MTMPAHPSLSTPSISAAEFANSTDVEPIMLRKLKGRIKEIMNLCIRMSEVDQSLSAGQTHHLAPVHSFLLEELGSAEAVYAQLRKSCRSRNRSNKKLPRPVTLDASGSPTRT
jgi:hypothetical protein